MEKGFIIFNDIYNEEKDKLICTNVDDYIFKTYRDATQYLLDEGHEIYYDYFTELFGKDGNISFILNDAYVVRSYIKELKVRINNAY